MNLKLLAAYFEKVNKNCLWHFHIISTIKGVPHLLKYRCYHFILVIN